MHFKVQPMEINRKLNCALEPFGFAIVCSVLVNAFSVICEFPLVICISGIATAFAIVRVIWREPSEYDIAIRSITLGVLFSLGLTLFFKGILWQFGLYLCALSFFHWSEFATLAYTNPTSVSIDSFMLNHSMEYLVAAVCSWVEYFVEYYFFPDLKLLTYVSIGGIILIIIGEAIRKLAILHLGRNFTHIIQVVPLQNHQLVTDGLYNYIRHPSYMGWFWFSVGTQLLLVNPFCVLAYAATAWLFFRDRIEAEEILLTQFFGSAYLAYKERTFSGLPFIKGYIP